MLRFRCMRRPQTFTVVHSQIHNLFNTERSFFSRPVYKLHSASALAEWRALCAD